MKIKNILLGGMLSLTVVAGFTSAIQVDAAKQIFGHKDI